MGCGAGRSPLARRPDSRDSPCWNECVATPEPAHYFTNASQIVTGAPADRQIGRLLGLAHRFV